jgi:hypothetical protein
MVRRIRMLALDGVLTDDIVKLIGEWKAADVAA